MGAGAGANGASRALAFAAIGQRLGHTWAEEVICWRTIVDLPSFTGEFGGLIATAWIAGSVAGWTACAKIMLGPERERARKMEERLDRIQEKIETHFWEKR